jgi:hypothetical protein
MARSSLGGYTSTDAPRGTTLVSPIAGKAPPASCKDPAASRRVTDSRRIHAASARHKELRGSAVRSKPSCRSYEGSIGALHAARLQRRADGVETLGQPRIRQRLVGRLLRSTCPGARRLRGRIPNARKARRMLSAFEVEKWASSVNDWRPTEEAANVEPPETHGGRRGNGSRCAPWRVCPAFTARVDDNRCRVSC